MGASKRYKDKDCAYCGGLRCTSTNDHVIARAFFLDDERSPTLELPQVPACLQCNNKKSALELYVVSSLLIASKHPEASRYLREKIRPRLEKNRKLWRELNLDAEPRWIMINGIYQPIHEIQIDSERTLKLLQLIVRGLYSFHFGKVLPPEYRPDVQMILPEAEALMWANFVDYFPAGAPRITNDLGRGTFSYSCVQSPANENFTAWIINLHGGVPLHGQDGSADHWWCMTRPTSEAVAAEKAAQSSMLLQQDNPDPSLI